MSSYREIGGPSGLLATLKSFKGNSMSARWVDGVYHVYSYTTIIAWFDPATGKLWQNERKYSQTTSRQQNLVAAWLAPLEGKVLTK